MPKALSLEERINKFWSQVNKTESCWLWTGVGSGSHGDYGTFVHLGKKYYAHRFSYEISIGKIPDGMKVLHKCDTPRCVNPDHLFLGTMSDNAYDMVKKGRHGLHLHPEKISRGEKHYQTHLKESDILEIKSMYLDQHVMQKEIAKKFNVAQSTISEICSGKRWNI